MVSYLKEVEILKCQFKKLELSHVSRGGNSHADSLVTLAFTMAGPLRRIVSVELLPFSSLTPSNNGLVLSINSSTSWMDPIVVRISALKSYCMMLCMLLCMTLCMT